MLSYNQCITLFESGSRNGRKKMNHNTYLYKSGSDFVIEAHGNPILIIKPDGSYQLSSCGLRTAMIKKRLNAFSPVRVYQHKFMWFVSGGHLPLENDIIFQDNMVVNGPQET